MHIKKVACQKMKWANKVLFHFRFVFFANLAAKVIVISVETLFFRCGVDLASGFFRAIIRHPLFGGEGILSAEGKC